MSDEVWLDVAYERFLRSVYTLVRLEYLRRLNECDR